MDKNISGNMDVVVDIQKQLLENSERLLTVVTYICHMYLISLPSGKICKSSIIRGSLLLFSKFLMLKHIRRVKGVVVYFRLKSYQCAVNHEFGNYGSIALLSGPLGNYPGALENYLRGRNFIWIGQSSSDPLSFKLWCFITHTNVKSHSFWRESLGFGPKK